MKIKITLSNSAGELDCEIVEIPSRADADEVETLIGHATGELIDRCVLSIGDTISITEVA